MMKHNLPQHLGKPSPSRPGLIYSQRGSEFARIMSSASVNEGPQRRPVAKPAGAA